MQNIMGMCVQYLGKIAYSFNILKEIFNVKKVNTDLRIRKA